MKRGIFVVCFGLIMAAAQADEGVTERLAKLNADADQRSAAFMRSISPRFAALNLDAPVTARNLVSSEGRKRIRDGFNGMAALLDEIDEFQKAEDATVDSALDSAASGLPAADAARMRSAYKHGYARTAQLHAALHGAQRQRIKASLELVQVFEGAGSRASLLNERLVVHDPALSVEIQRVMQRLDALEKSEARAEAEIDEHRRRSHLRIEEVLRPLH